MTYRTYQKPNSPAEPNLGRAASARLQSGRLTPSVALSLLLVACTLSAVDFPLRWRWSNPSPHGNNIVDMSYSPALGIGIQVTEKGQLYTSSDLQLWTPRESHTTDALRAVTFFGNRIVVTGQNGRVLYADSVHEFKTGTLTGGPTSDWLEGVAASPSTVVAVGDRSAIYTTTTGTNWTRQTSPIPDWLRGVTYGNNLFVAVGDLGQIISSPDGTNWTRRASNTLTRLYRVFFHGGQFTAVGEAGMLLNSSDGITWSQESSGTSAHLLNGTANPGARLAVGDGAVQLKAANGWEDQLAIQSPPPDWTYFCNIALPNSFLIAGQTGMMSQGIKTNASPYFWRPFSPSPRHWLFDLFYATNLYVTVGDNATIMTSANGVDWTLELVPNAVTNATFLGVGGTTNLLIAVGDSGSAVRSPHTFTNISVTNIVGTNIIITQQTVSTLGLDWYSAPLPTTRDLQGVTFFNGRYLVSGDEGTILSSLNGTNWTLQATPTTKYLSSAAASPSLAVATGDDGTIISSANGTQWDLRASGTTKWLYRVRFLGDGFAAVGENGAVALSPDGINWTSQDFPTTSWLNDITRVDDTYFIVGNQGTVLTSTNASDWINRGTITGKSLFGVATDGAQLLTVGFEGIILRSPVVPDLTPIEFLNFSRFPSADRQFINNLYLFAGVVDQQFTIDYRRSLDTNQWVPGLTLEFQESSGTLFYLEQIALTNAPPLEFYRGTLKY